MPRTLIDQLFELGVMGIEVPEEHGGAGASSFTPCWRSSRSPAWTPRSASSSTCRTRWSSMRCVAGQPDLARQRSCRDWPSAPSAPTPCRKAASGSDAFALATRATPSTADFVPQRPQALDHQRRRRRRVHRLRHRRSRGRLQEASPRSWSNAAHPDSPSARKEDKLGIRASSTCELLFDDCRVAGDRVLGEVGKGYKVAIETLNEGRIGIGAQMVGLAQGALDHAIRYVKERRQFGKPIADFQGVQFQIARAATEIEAARLLVYDAARLRDAGQPFLSEAAMCKLFASEMAERVASLAVNLYRRQRLREGLSGREAVSRCQDRPDLRRHLQPAAADHRQAAAGVTAPQRHAGPGREHHSMTDILQQTVNGMTCGGCENAVTRTLRTAAWHRRREGHHTPTTSSA